MHPLINLKNWDNNNFFKKKESQLGFVRKVLLYRSVCKPRSAISYECFSKFAFTPFSVQPLGFQRTHHVNRDASITKTMHLDRMINSWGYKFRIYICQILTLHVSLSSEFLLPGVRRGLLLARIKGESWIRAHIFLKTVQMGYTSTLNTPFGRNCGINFLWYLLDGAHQDWIRRHLDQDWRAP